MPDMARDALQVLAAATFDKAGVQDAKLRIAGGKAGEPLTNVATGKCAYKLTLDLAALGEARAPVDHI